MSMKPIVIEAFDIPDATWQIIKACMHDGYERPVFRGARKEQLRKELDFLVGHIRHPETRPLCIDTSNIKDEFGNPFPALSSDEDINKYLEYIAVPDKAKDQDYTYGQRAFGTINLNTEIAKFMAKHDKQEGQNIHNHCNQFDVITQFLQETPETNRATVEVGMAQDLFLEHPPCLRFIQYKIRYGKLHSFYVFRSWDAMYGLPMNLGAYQKLAESLVDDLNESYDKKGLQHISCGEMFFTSFGAHVYSGQWKYAELLIGKKHGERTV